MSCRCFIAKPPSLTTVDFVTNPPTSYDELITWTQKHPKSFGYNGIKNGMSGVSFVTGWIYAYGTKADTLSSAPLWQKCRCIHGTKPSLTLKISTRTSPLHQATLATLDMLNRWWNFHGACLGRYVLQLERAGQIPPSMKLSLIAPGMPGQPMYYVTPTKAAHPELAREFIELATSPEIQAKAL